MCGEQVAAVSTCRARLGGVGGEDGGVGGAYAAVDGRVIARGMRYFFPLR